MKVLNKFRPIIIALLYSLFFLSSEYVYRIVFDIPTMRNLLESYALIFAFVLLMLMVKSRITGIFIWLFFTISVVGNNIHYEFYQSWLTATNYLLFITEITEVTHVGLNILPKLLLPFVWGAVESLVFASLVLFRRRKTIIADIIVIMLFAFICIRSFSTTQQHAISPNPDYSRLKSNYFTLGYFLVKHYLTIFFH